MTTNIHTATGETREQIAKRLIAEAASDQRKLDAHDDLVKALQKVSALCQQYRFEMSERAAYSVLTNVMAEADEALTKAGVA